MTGPHSPGDDRDNLVTIGRFINPIEAQFARSLLESDGLTSFVQGGGSGSLLPTATVFPILLQVRAGDADRAAEILAEIPASEEPEPGEAARHERDSGP